MAANAQRLPQICSKFLMVTSKSVRCKKSRHQKSDVAHSYVENQGHTADKLFVTVVPQLVSRCLNSNHSTTCRECKRNHCPAMKLGQRRIHSNQLVALLLRKSCHLLAMTRQLRVPATTRQQTQYWLWSDNSTHEFLPRL